MNSGTKRGAWLLWIAAVGFLVALLFFPASYRLTRLASIALFAMVWFGLLALTWSSRLVRYLLLGVSLLAVTFVSLPRRAGSDSERLRQEYVVRLQHYEGVKYFWGGENGLGIDCSGLIRRGLINALFRQGVRTADGGSIRDAADLWWHDCTASALGAGNGGQTVSVLDTPSVNALDHSGIVPGDLAVTSDGEIIANPRFLRAKQRKLAHAQRALSRTAKGSANRTRARRRLAVVHRKVRETRLDHAHKTALALVRDSQAVYAEDLAVSGLARTRLAKSVHDAGWAQLLRLIGEKAQQYGRTFHQVGRFTPTSQTCSVCGTKDGPKPLRVRSWRCGMCGAVHDRDVNAARNVLAAGRAERLNACGGTIRPGAPLARPGETGTHRGVA